MIIIFLLYSTLKAALADWKKVVKTGSIFEGRGRDMGRGSAESRLRGMSRGSVGAWLRGMGRGSAGEEFRGMGSGAVQKNDILISISDICATCLGSLADNSFLILGQWDKRIY